MNILVSACLLGISCRYDGRGGTCEELQRLAERHHLIPVCPECYGGLPTPRPPAEILPEDGESGIRVVTRDGADVTAQYIKGGQAAVELAAFFHCTVAILKSRSPACGHGRIHDGGFAGGMRDGDGVAARMLIERGLRILNETQTEEIRRL